MINIDRWYDMVLSRWTMRADAGSVMTRLAVLYCFFVFFLIQMSMTCFFFFLLASPT